DTAEQNSLQPLFAQVFLGTSLAASCMQAAAGWVLGILASRWSAPAPPADPSCTCIFSGHEPSSGVLDILREQLSRCGPEHLGAACPACPACVCPQCPAPAAPSGAWVLVVLVGLASFAAGVAAAAAWLLRAGPPRAVLPPLALAEGPAGELVGAATPCLVRYDDDENFQWHHRVLLVKGPDQWWVWVTPDGEIAAANLGGFRVVALQRGGAFPDRYRGNIYVFDDADVDAEEMHQYYREARALGDILGYPASAAPLARDERWFVSDPTSPQYGEEVPAASVGNDEVLIRRGEVGLVLIDDVWQTAVRVEAGGSFEEWQARARGGPGRDPRIAGDERDEEKDRFMSFRASVSKMREQAIPGWPLKGKRATREACLALRDAGQEGWDEHHTTWVRRSGIPEKSNTAREHRMLCSVLRIMQQFDQLDLYNVAGVEYMVRRLKQLEAATRRNPRQPDFDGLDVVLDAAIDESGGFVLPAFDAWVGEQQRSEAAIMKAGRQWREETSASGSKDKPPKHPKKAVRSINDLSRASVHGFGSVPARGSTTPGAPSATQASCLAHLRRNIGRHGPRPPGLTPRGALQELLKSDSLYAGAPSKVAPYSEDKLKFWKSKIVPKRVEDICPDFVVRAFADPDRYVRKPDRVFLADAEGLDPIVPYWDPHLAGSPDARVRFVRRLAERGLVGYRRRIRARVGCFFVEKKGGFIRLVVDARETNRTHWSPPHAALGTPAALAEQDWSDAALGASDATSAPAIYGASLDLADSFYQFCSDALAEDFGMDYPEPASVYGATHVWEDGRLIPVGADDVVFPAFRGVAMGWSWALWVVHSSVTSWVGHALTGGPASLVLDRQPPRPAAPGRPAGSVYVDNVGILGLSAADAAAGLASVMEELDRRGIVYHEVCEPSLEFGMVGVVYDGVRRTLRHSDERAWRLHFACLELERPGVPRAAWQVRVVLGHFIQHCLLLRPAMSIFRHLYRYVDECRLGPPSPLPSPARQEVSVFRGLIFQAVVDLAAPVSDIVLCSDSSEAGYALHRRRCDPEAVRRLARLRERWRFTPDEKRPEALEDDTYTPGWLPGAGGVLGEGDPSCGIATWAPPPRRADERPHGTVRARVAQAPRRATFEDIPDELVAPEAWSLVVEGAWRTRAPIHILEARIALAGLRHASRSLECHGRRVLSLGDNMAEVLSTEKGRAVDVGLGSVCRRSAAIQVATGIRWRRRYLDTGRNVSDGGSRKALQGLYRPGQRRVGPGAGTPGACRPPRVTCSFGEVFSGCGRWTGALAQAGLVVAAPMDIKHGPWCDLLNPKVESQVRSWITSRAVWFVHFGTPCTPWSISRRGAREVSAIRAARRCAHVTVRLLEVCSRYGIHWSLENPQSSGLFRWAPLRKFLDQHSRSWATYHCCRFGAPYKKPTTIVSSLGALHDIGLLCEGGRRHEHLSGKVRVRAPTGGLKLQWKTTLAGAYPPGACHLAASILAAAAPRGARSDAEQWGGVWGPPRVTATTAERYHASLHEFAAQMGLDPARWTARDLPAVDAALDRFLEELFVAERSRGDARYVLAAVADHFNVSLRQPGVLPLARAAMAGWGKLEPDSTSDPLPWSAAVLMAYHLSRTGVESDLEAARGLVVQFDTYLRPSELVLMPLVACFTPGMHAGVHYNKYGMVVAPSSQVAGQLIGIRTSKTGVQDDTVLLDEASRPGVVGAFAALIRQARRARSQTLLPSHTYVSYNKVLQRAARAVGIPFKVTPHLARHGGPSEDFLRRARTLPEIQARGRWASFRSVQRYEKAGRLLAAIRKLPPAVRSAACQAE
ncbi:unnamed protein product, partial [Prorocentrum cordatum]